MTHTAFDDILHGTPKNRFDGILRNYSVADAVRLRGSVSPRHTLAELGAARLWRMLQGGPAVRALGAMTGNQAMQMVRAGVEAIYLSGWQVAADSNTASAMYPDQSLYPADAGPELARRINRTLQRADQIQTMESGGGRRRRYPLVRADRRRCRGRVRRAVERLRDHEGLY